MAILVTGGAGYIGSHTCLELIKEGYQVIILDNLSNSNMESIYCLQEITSTNICFYNVDLLDIAGLESIFENNLIEAVIHFAGYKAVGESIESPISYYLNNITGTLNLCEVMRKYNVKRFIFSSSATVYSSTNNGAISEDFSLGPTNPYGRTKLVIEEFLRDLYHSDNSWSILVLRYFNPIGAHSSGKIGEHPKGTPNNLIPFILQVAIGERRILRVFGGDYPTIDGTGVRDYIHVVDLAIGHLKALKKVMSPTKVEVYNLGTGKGFSVLEIVRAFEKESGKLIPYTIVNRRAGDVAVSIADPSKAKMELGWEAKRGINEMCVDAWRWQVSNPNGYNHNGILVT